MERWDKGLVQLWFDNPEASMPATARFIAKTFFIPNILTYKDDLNKQKKNV